MLTANAVLAPEVQAKRGKDASVEKESSPAEGNKSVIDRATDEEGDPGEVEDSIRGSRQEVNGLLLVLAINSVVN